MCRHPEASHGETIPPMPPDFTGEQNPNNGSIFSWLRTTQSFISCSKRYVFGDNQ